MIKEAEQRKIRAEHEWNKHVLKANQRAKV